MAIARQRIHLPPAAWRRAFGGMLGRRLWDGDAVPLFESRFAEFIGVNDAIAVPSGRAGLRFIYDAIGLEPGAEVICASFAYPVVPHLTRSLGYRVRFAECELETLGMDPKALAAKITPATRVVIATHLYGVPCRIAEIAEIAARNGAILIEDCAHCFGAAVDDRRAGSFGDFAYFSFETSKPINTLGGGMVTTRDAEAAGRIRKIVAAEPGKDLGWLTRRLNKTTFEATVTHPLFFNLGVYPALRFAQRREETEERFASGYQRDEVTMHGRFGRYTNYQAELGLTQMKDPIPRIERRIANAHRLIERLAGKVHLQRNDRPGVVSNYMLVTALFPRMREVARSLLRMGVDTKHHYMRDCTGIAEDDGPFPIAARLEREVLHLPAYPELSTAQIDRVADNVLQAVETVGAVERNEALAG
jgi:dTDP-4-amino-4,6-dideoxygalactose transaminase